MKQRNVDWQYLTEAERKEKVRYHANNCQAHAWAKRWLRKHGDKTVTVQDVAEMEGEE
jgi:hypothetical protein